MLRSPSHAVIQAPHAVRDTYLDATMAPSASTHPPSLSESVAPPTYFTPVADLSWRPPSVNDHYPYSNDPMMTPSASDYPNNSIVVAVLIALVCILFLILIFVTVPPILHIIKRKIPVPQARIDRRYATIDGWLIRKVRKNNCCRNDPFSSRSIRNVLNRSHTSSLSITLCHSVYRFILVT
jgi:hypothetical protein